MFTMFCGTTAFSRDAWDKEPFLTLVKAFKEKMEDYSGGDIKIFIPFTMLERIQGSECRITIEASDKATELCKGNIGVDPKGSSGGVITFYANNNGFNAIEAFNNAIKGLDEVGLRILGLKTLQVEDNLFP